MLVFRLPSPHFLQDVRFLPQHELCLRDVTVLSWEALETVWHCLGDMSSLHHHVLRSEAKVLCVPALHGHGLS